MYSTLNPSQFNNHIMGEQTAASSNQSNKDDYYQNKYRNGAAVGESKHNFKY